MLNNQQSESEKYEDDEDYSQDDNESYEMNQQVASPQAFAAAKKTNESKPSSVAAIGAGEQKAGAPAGAKIEPSEDEIEEASDFVLDDDHIDL